jgi:hypothetical protein
MVPLLGPVHAEPQQRSAAGGVGHPRQIDTPVGQYVAGGIAQCVRVVGHRRRILRLRAGAHPGQTVDPVQRAGLDQFGGDGDPESTGQMVVAGAGRP